MAQTLQQVIQSLNSVYNPQVGLLRERQKALPAQMQAEEQGLQAKQTQAYDEILGGARRRGMGFSGIPLAEQAKYNSTEYMPALARLRQQSKDQAMSLEEAILGVRERQQGTGMSYWQALNAQDQWQREFNERKRQFELGLAESRRASGGGGGGGGFAPSFGGVSMGGGAKPASPAGVPASMQTLYNRVFIKGDGTAWDDRSLVSDYNATYKSAQYGNRADQQKIRLYHSTRPDLFGSAIPKIARNVIPYRN